MHVDLIEGISNRISLIDDRLSVRREITLARAGQTMPREPVRTLDAVHLATALLFREALSQPVAIASCDRVMRENARELGFALVPVD